MSAPRVANRIPTLGDGEERRVVRRVAYRDRAFERSAIGGGPVEDGPRGSALVRSPRYGDPLARARGREPIAMQQVEELLGADARPIAHANAVSALQRAGVI